MRGPLRSGSPSWPATWFEVMATGGRVGFETVAWFNGGLFDDSTTLPLKKSDIETVLAASDLDWSEIDPSILGTLFERGLDPGKRAQLGAHYTDRDKIMLLVEPVVVRPLLVEWETEKATIAAEPGTRGGRQVSRGADETAQRGRAAVPGIPRAATHVHGAGSGVRLGELPLLGAALRSPGGWPRSSSAVAVEDGAVPILDDDLSDLAADQPRVGRCRSRPPGAGE